MVIYLLNIFLILIWGIFLIYNNPTVKKRIWFCVIASVQWTLVSGLRGASVGADTFVYMRTFNIVGTTSWKDILNAFVDVYFHGRKPLTSGENFFIKIPDI